MTEQKKHYVVRGIPVTSEILTDRICVFRGRAAAHSREDRGQRAGDRRGRPRHRF